MKITITGKPKEIAALAVETQRRQSKLSMELRVSRDLDDFKAMKKGIALLRALQSGELGQALQSSGEQPGSL